MAIGLHQLFKRLLWPSYLFGNSRPYSVTVQLRANICMVFKISAKIKFIVKAQITRNCFYQF